MLPYQFSLFIMFYCYCIIMFCWSFYKNIVFYKLMFKKLVTISCYVPAAHLSSKKFQAKEFNYFLQIHCWLQWKEISFLDNSYMRAVQKVRRVIFVLKNTVTKLNETIGIFLSWVSAHTVKIAQGLHSYKEKYLTVEMELPLPVYVSCEVRSITWFL